MAAYPQSTLDQWQAVADGCAARAGGGNVGGVCLIGDSRVGYMNFPTLGGMRCNPVSFGGSRIQVLQSYAAEVLTAFRPAVVVILTGINNAFLPTNDPEYATMNGDYAGLVGICQQHAPKVVIATAMPPEIGWAPPEPATTLARANTYLAPVNTIIRGNATFSGLPLIDLALKLSRPDGTALTGTTFDGIHPTQGGIDLYQQILDHAISGLF